MKPNIVGNVVLFFCSYCPLFLILLIKDINFKIGCQLDLIKYFNNPIVSMFLILIIVICFFGFLIVNKITFQKNSTKIRIVNCKNKSIDLINYTVPYIVSFFGYDLSEFGNILSLLIFLIIMFNLTVKSKTIFMNPILILMGYSLYDVVYQKNGVDFQISLLSKEDFIKDDTINISALSSNLFIVTK